MKKSAQVPVTKEQDAAWTGTAPTREAPSNQNQDSGNYRDAGAVAGGLTGAAIGSGIQYEDSPSVRSSRASRYDQRVLDIAGQIDDLVRTNPELAASLDQTTLDRLYSQTGNRAFKDVIPADYWLMDPEPRFQGLDRALEQIDPYRDIRQFVIRDNNDRAGLEQAAADAAREFADAETAASDARHRHIDPLEGVVAQAREELERRRNGLSFANAKKKMHADEVSSAQADEQAASRHRAELQRQLNAAERARVEAERTLARRRSDPIATRNRDAAINEATRLRGEISAADSAIADARSRVAPFNDAIADARNARTIAEGELEAAEADLSNARLTHEAPYRARLDRAGEVRDAANRSLADFEAARARRVAEMLIDPASAGAAGSHSFDAARAAAGGFTPADVRALAAVAREDPAVYAELKGMLTDAAGRAIAGSAGTVPPGSTARLDGGFAAAEELAKLLKDNSASIQPPHPARGTPPDYRFDYSRVNPRVDRARFDPAAYKEIMDFIESDSYKALTGEEPPSFSVDRRLQRDFDRIRSRIDSLNRRKNRADSKAEMLGGPRRTSMTGEPLINPATGLPMRDAGAVPYEGFWRRLGKGTKRIGGLGLIGMLGGGVLGSQISTPASVDAAGGNTNDYRKH